VQEVLGVSLADAVVVEEYAYILCGQLIDLRVKGQWVAGVADDVAAALREPQKPRAITCLFSWNTMEVPVPPRLSV